MSEQRDASGLDARPSIIPNFYQILSLLTLNSKVNKLDKISKSSQNASMGVYGMVFWGGESIFEVKM